MHRLVISLFAVSLGLCVASTALAQDAPVPEDVFAPQSDPALQLELTSIDVAIGLDVDSRIRRDAWPTRDWSTRREASDPGFTPGLTLRLSL